jgi:hypothetical protein
LLALSPLWFPLTAYLELSGMYPGCRNGEAPIAIVGRVGAAREPRVVALEGRLRHRVPLALLGAVAIWSAIILGVIAAVGGD